MSSLARVWMTAPEAAQALGRSPEYVRRLVQTGILPGRKANDGRYRIAADAVYHMRAGDHGRKSSRPIGREASPSGVVGRKPQVVLPAQPQPRHIAAGRTQPAPPLPGAADRTTPGGAPSHDDLPSSRSGAPAGGAPTSSEAVAPVARPTIISAARRGAEG